MRRADVDRFRAWLMRQRPRTQIAAYALIAFASAAVTYLIRALIGASFARPEDWLAWLTNLILGTVIAGLVGVAIWLIPLEHELERLRDEEEEETAVEPPEPVSAATAGPDEVEGA